MRFPENFLWGAASAAYQIEGSIDADGKGRSIWDDFVQKPGVINDGSTGDTACDGYRRYKADIALMAELGIPVADIRRELASRHVIDHKVKQEKMAGDDEV